jgi:hypothetical protein
MMAGSRESGGGSRPGPLAPSAAGCPAAGLALPPGMLYYYYYYYYYYALSDVALPEAACDDRGDHQASSPVGHPDPPNGWHYAAAGSASR